METLESLGKRIATTKDLQSIVRTMKSLSAVSIRQYEHAVLALRAYSRTIELGFQLIMRERPLPPAAATPRNGTTLAIVFGSDHGLCGRFNEQIVQFADGELRRTHTTADQVLCLTLGLQAAIRLAAVGRQVEESFFLPGTVSGLTATAHSVLSKIDAWQGTHGSLRVLLFHNVRTTEATAAPVTTQLLPLDPDWLGGLARRPWPSRGLPTHSMEGEALFSALVHEHLFVSTYGAGAESMASEHATRLASLQAAERNIQEHLEEMNGAFRRRRQQAITEELLDVVAGFEILRSADPSASDMT